MYDNQFGNPDVELPLRFIPQTCQSVHVSLTPPRPEYGRSFPQVFHHHSVQTLSYSKEDHVNASFQVIKIHSNNRHSSSIHILHTRDTNQTRVL